MAKMLLIVDPQIDFINGSLPVPLAAEAMNELANYLKVVSGMYDVKVVSVDFHPWNHCSFKENGGEWSAHCIGHTTGAAIWPTLVEPVTKTGGPVKFIRKGEDEKKEEYSLFSCDANSQMFKSIVNDYSITEIDVCGIVREICVMNTIKDLHAQYPNMKVNVLMPYTPSLDGGMTFAKYLDENQEWLTPRV